MNRLTLIGLVVLLCACAETQPVVMVGKDRHTLIGTATGAPNGGKLSLTDGKLTCSGNYDSPGAAIAIGTQILCSDGRQGIITAAREIHLSDDSDWKLISGPAATSY